MNHGREDFHEAYRKFLASIPELKVIRLRSLKDLLIEFMNNANYDPANKRLQWLRFVAVAWIGKLMLRSWRGSHHDCAQRREPWSPL